MALTEFQRTICHIIADYRIENGESYVASGAALNTIIRGDQVSRDIDVFHDSTQAVAESWAADRHLLESHGYDVHPLREREGYVEAIVSRANDSVVMQWATDSAFRFFPLVRHDDFGLALHPMDLATNKALALVGRLEVRDWIDMMRCHEGIQRLGYLAWAASGKDPSFSPAAILDQAARTARYSASEIESLTFAGPPPSITELGSRWREMLHEAAEIIAMLPPAATGTCVLDDKGLLFADGPSGLRKALTEGAVFFHEGSLRGALPAIRRQR